MVKDMWIVGLVVSYYDDFWKFGYKVKVIRFGYWFI